jgi:nitrate/TMAO reductase-like tetraheme cytochrome c subunit
MSFLPSCHEVQTELTEYMEGTLPFTRRAGIWLHLVLCHVCASFLRGLRALPVLAKAALAAPNETPEAAAKALARVQAVLEKRD